MAKRGRKPKVVEDAKPRKAFAIMRASYDSAQTTNHNKKHWGRTSALSADKNNDAATRILLRERSRYEVDNNSYAKGIILTLANDTIGTGPRLQMMTDDDAVNSEIEGAFYAWCRATNFFEKLRTMRMARTQDGEAFAIMATNPASTFPVKLDLQLIECDQVKSASKSVLDPKDVDGVLLDSFGNPEFYTITKAHPGSGSPEATLYEKIPAANMLHDYRMDRPGQHRGIPEITPALELFAQLRRYTLAVLNAAETAADFAAIMYTDNPANGEAAENTDPFGSIELDRNSMMSLPEGWKIEQLRAEQPTTTYAEFKHEILNEIARCLNMPFNVAASNSSGYNYSSGRMDWQTYYKSIRVYQSGIENTILDRVFKAWLTEYAMTPGVSVDAEIIPPHQWFWDGMEHVDPLKEANATAQDLLNNTTTLSIECAKRGRDWEEVLRQRAREAALMKELGLKQEEPKQSEPTATEEEIEEA